jgi:hypothetical protein
MAADQNLELTSHFCPGEYGRIVVVAARSVCISPPRLHHVVSAYSAVTALWNNMMTPTSSGDRMRGRTRLWVSRLGGRSQLPWDVGGDAMNAVASSRARQACSDCA